MPGGFQILPKGHYILTLGLVNAFKRKVAKKLS